MFNRFMWIGLLALLPAAAALAADISGAWQFNLVTPTTKGSPSFEFKQDEEKLTGTYVGKFGQAPVAGTVKGDKIEFSFETPKGKFHYEGTIEGAAMKGDFENIGAEKGTFTAAKK
jgi:hypothetical protein